jgi:hypothetical protein
MSQIKSPVFARFDKLRQDVAASGPTGQLRGTKDARGTRIFKRDAGTTGTLLERTYNLLFGRAHLKRHLDKALDEVRGFAEISSSIKADVAAVKLQARTAGGDLKAGKISGLLENIQNAVNLKTFSIGHTPSLLGGKGAIETAIKEAKAAGAIDATRMVDTLSKAIAKDLRQNEALKTIYNDDTVKDFKAEFRAKLKQQIEKGGLESNDKEIATIVDRAVMCAAILEIPKAQSAHRE